MYIIYVIVCAHVYQNISFGKIPVDFYFAFSPLSIFSLFFCNKFILFLQKKKVSPISEFSCNFGKSYPALIGLHDR